MTTSPDDPGDPFAQAPLFRELQRVLLSSPGPVNWELARQLGIATAAAEADTSGAPAATDADRRSLADTVRIAELQVASLTGLAPPADIATVEIIDRPTWIVRTLKSFEGLLEPIAERVSQAFASLPAPGDGADVGALPPGVDAEAMRGAMGQLSPLLLGAQAGTVIGAFGAKALGSYDLGIPRGDDDVAFVVANMAGIESDWSLDPVEFRLWVAVHEVANRFAFGRSWPREHLATLVRDVASVIQPDAGALMQRLEGLDIADPDAMRSAMTDNALLTTTPGEESQLRLDRLQAFLGITAGFADHITEALGRKLLGSHDRIAEAIRRHREGEEGERLFERLLGIEMGPDCGDLGRVFCARVAEDAGAETLARLWDEPDALPSLPELVEPTLWMSRTV